MACLLQIPRSQGGQEGQSLGNGEVGHERMQEAGDLLAHLTSLQFFWLRLVSGRFGDAVDRRAAARDVFLRAEL